MIVHGTAARFSLQALVPLQTLLPASVAPQHAALRKPLTVACICSSEYLLLLL